MTKKTSKRSLENKNRNMKQGQQKIKLDIKKPSPSSPPLPLPFPPTQRVEQIVAKLVAKPKLARFPNAFIMYRNEYVQFLKSQGYHISMTELSPMISTSWKRESEFVKETYTKLSSEAEKMYVRDTGNTQQQINYKYLPAQRPKIESNGILDDPPRQSHHHQSQQTHQLHTNTTNFGNDILINNLNIYYDRLIQQSSITQNRLPRNHTRESEQIPPLSELISFSQAKIDDSIAQQDNCISDNFFPWISNISPPIHHHLPPVPSSYAPSSYSPSTASLEELPNLIDFPPLETPLLESMSPSNSSSPSEASFEEFSLLLSSELDESGFSEFSNNPYTDGQTPISPLQSPDLFLYPVRL